MQEGHPIAILQSTELQWSTQPEETSLPATSETGVKGLQLRSFKTQGTDFTYNPSIMFTTTTTYADSSWIKMDTIIDVKRTLVVEFSFDDAANFNINPYIYLTLLPNTIKHYYSYNSNPAYRCFRPGPKMSFKHKKKRGKFLPYKITEFVGLRAKLYAIKKFDGEEEKKCKGVKRNVIRSKISFNDYKDVLFSGKEVLRTMNVIRSRQHSLSTEQVNKIALSANDGKRTIKSDKMQTFAHGYRTG